MALAARLVIGYERSRCVRAGQGRRQSASAGTESGHAARLRHWICLGGARASVYSELPGVATRYPGHLPFPIPMSPTPHPQALGSSAWRL
ncbi:MAG TPA: hypothetical protein VEH31_40840 [Streptosporangiaceae bacterium]|nr:hypothetical protein [Streptosporangiaceae bacterium]